MKRYALSRKADADMDGVFDYIARDAPPRAEKMVRRIEAAMLRLARNPFLGSDCSEYGSNMRFWTVKPFIIYYAPAEFGIEVFRVLHGARDINKLMS